MSCVILASLVSLSLVAPGEQVFVQQDSLRSGLVTSPMLDADPPSIRVSWIHWDSGFRGSGLQVGDQIIAINGDRIVRPQTLQERQRMGPKLIGQYAEHQGWTERRAGDGTAVTLTVLRRPAVGEGIQQLQITGKVLAERSYRSASNQPLLGPGGPQRMFQNDGFSSSWASWYEEERGFARFGERVLDGGFRSGRITSRSLLRDLLEWQDRVDLLVKRYPGPFSRAVSEDFERLRALLTGTRYTLTPEELEYRQLGEKRMEEIRAEAKKAREAFLAAHAKELIEPFPAVDPVRGDRSKVTGKLVALPEIFNRDWVMEADHCYLASGDSSRGHYFIDCELPSMARLYGARHRYEKLVAPRLAESYTVIGRILPDPKLLVARSRATPGLQVDPVGVTVGDHQMFVDLSVVKRGEKEDESPFAGEAALTRPREKPLTAEASPRQVMEAWVEALKVGDEQTWKSLFADWRAESGDVGQPVYYRPYDPPPQLDSDWLSSRKAILGDVFAAKVVYASAVRQVMTGQEFKGAPVVEEVSLELEHVGQFEGEYRAFTSSVSLHRVWTLQRRDGGPWRIASRQSL